jgi:hypothetical protein
VKIFAVRARAFDAVPGWADPPSCYARTARICPVFRGGLGVRCGRRPTGSMRAGAAACRLASAAIAITAIFIAPMAVLGRREPPRCAEQAHVINARAVGHTGTPHDSGRGASVSHKGVRK